MTHVSPNPIAGDAGKIYVLDVELDNVAVTTADSTAYVIADLAGTTISSGTLSYVSSIPIEGLTEHAAWFANVTWPSTAQDVLITMTITKSSAPRTWRQRVTIEAGIP